jgi:hypothetical protein
MERTARVIVGAVLLVCALPLTGLALSPYSQDFEALPPVNGSLAGNGWLNYGNVFDPAGNYLYGYGPFGAVNNIGNWQDIVTGQGGPMQGNQQLVVYSDYANGSHGAGNWVESNCYQEQSIPAGATGTWRFIFDAKRGNIGGASTARGFIKTLDPSSGWQMTNYIIADMTSIPDTWGTYWVSINVTGLDGQILQFGFSSTATNYEPCGIFYDNVGFAESPSPVETTSWSAVKALFR